MNTTHEYTDEQIQAAIDAALSASDLSFRDCAGDALVSGEVTHFARAFLAALPKPAEPDTYARLKAYNEAGAMIRAFDTAAGKWDLWVNKFPWDWTLPVNHYEAHPDDLHMVPEYAPKPQAWTLPAPPAGFRWHREDWKPEWLEGGYRPLLDGEVIEAGDEYCPCGFGPWKPAALDGWAYCVGVRVNSRAVRFRTRRPLPAEASAEPEQAEVGINGLTDAQTQATASVSGLSKPVDNSPPWIPHDGKGCPLKDEEVEEWGFKFRSGDTVEKATDAPSSYTWVHDGDDWWGDKVAYRVLRWKPGNGPQAAQYYMPKLPNPLAQPEPATFEAHGKTWTRHTPGDPCPVDPEANIELLLAGGGCYDGQARFQSWGQIRNNPDNAIIGWRHADEPAQAEKEDVETIKRERDSLRASLEADKEWIIKAHSMLDDRRWAGKSEMEGLVTELEEAWQEIKELVLPEPAQAEATGTEEEKWNEYQQELMSPDQPWTPKPGDVVRLKSGGPRMTVNTVAEGYARLIWIDASGFYRLCNATFSALTPAN